MTKDQLPAFIESVRLAPTDADHEEFVRQFTARVAKNAPLAVVLKMAEAMIDYRKAEIKAEAERN